MAMSSKPLARQVMPGPSGAESATAADGSIRPRDSWFHWCGTVDALSGATNRNERQAALEVYFSAVAEESVAPAVRFFSGEFFPQRVEATRIPWTVIAEAIEGLTRLNVHRRRARRIVQGDLSNAVAERFAGRLPSGVSMVDVDSWAHDLAAADGAEAQHALLHDMLARLSAIEAKYLVCLIAGELHIEISRQQIEEALAKARGTQR